MKTEEILIEFIKFNTTLSLLGLGAFGWITAKEVEQTGKFRWYQAILIFAFLANCLNINEVAGLIVSMVKESKAEPPNYSSDEIQSNLKWALRYLWCTAGLLTAFLVFHLKFRGKDAIKAVEN